MVSVSEAEKIIFSQKIDYGIEIVSLENCLSRVLAENLLADRDLPPFNRVTMDGIAIKYSTFDQGKRNFKIISVLSAGEKPISEIGDDECIEIMTGAVMPDCLDTVIRYEEIEIENGNARLQTENIRRGQNLHLQGTDILSGNLLCKANKLITAAVVGTLASIGKSEVVVKKLPRIKIIATGNELIAVNQNPEYWQIRMSNVHSIKASLQKFGLESKIDHISDDLESIKKVLEEAVELNDVVIISGGISMGKLDHIPQALKEIGVQMLFHKVAQRPGKPFWFGKMPKGTLVFAFPGNPVSSFLCLYRYFIPWLELTLGLGTRNNMLAKLAEDVNFKPPLTYFMQVLLEIDCQGNIIAIPSERNGSGDFVNLLHTNAFLELPAERINFVKGEVFKAWVFDEIWS